MLKWNEARAFVVTNLITTQRLGGYSVLHRGIFQMFYMNNNFIITVYQWQFALINTNCQGGPHQLRGWGHAGVALTSLTMNKSIKCHILELNEHTDSCPPNRHNYILHFLGIFFSFLLMRSAEHDSFTKILWVYLGPRNWNLPCCMPNMGEHLLVAGESTNTTKQNDTELPLNKKK